MINHARTLLLNKAAVTESETYEEYIPADFVPRKLTPELHQVWCRMFGNNLPRKALNYRARQLMTLLHGTELEQHVLELDPRVTYWPPHNVVAWEKPHEGLIPLPELIGWLLPYYDKGFLDPTGRFREYWLNRQLPYKLGAAVLSYIYRVKDLR